MKKKETQECPACLKEVVPTIKPRTVMRHQCQEVYGAFCLYVNEKCCPKCGERL